MSDKANIFVTLEEKISLLGEQLRANVAEKIALTEEVNALKNKMTNLERLVQEGKGDDKTSVDGQQLDQIKGELDRHILEVGACVEMLKEL